MNNKVQTENGFTRIANELFEALLKLRLNSYEFRIAFAVIRKTYGFKKKEDMIALSQFTDLTGINKTHVSRALKTLQGYGIVTKQGNKLAINKDYTDWKVTKPGKGGVLPNQVKVVTQIGNKKLPNQALQKKKETITKEIVSKDTTAKQYGNAEINELIAYMKTTLDLPVLDKPEKTNRQYANLCIRKFGLHKAKLSIDAAKRSKFWRHKVTNFTTLYYNAIQIVQSAREEVRSVDATKVLHSKSGEKGDHAQPRGISFGKGSLPSGDKSGLV